MERGSRRRWLAAIAGTAAVVLLVAQGAAADQSYSDAVGDATNGAPDITTIRVTNDTAGWITFSVSVTGLPQAETLLMLPINADLNMSTGSSGDDFTVALEGQSLGAVGMRWDGSALVAWAPSMGLQSSFASGTWTVRLNKADVFGTNRFAFWLGAAKFAGGQIVGSDVAPEGTGVYTYDVTQPPPAPTPTPTPTPSPKPTPKPAAKPISAARLVGDFDMSLRLTAKQNMKVPTRDTGTWEFAPRCSGGACSTRLHTHLGSIIEDHVLNIRLNRTGARYSGTAKSVIAECNFKDVAGRTTVNVVVKRAAWIDGVWRATAVSGTYVQSAPRVESGMFYCPAGSAKYSFTGKLDEGL
jgi:hypothetical protein